MTQERADALISRREQLGARATSLAGNLQQRSAERQAIADEKDDAPPSSDLRPADRAGRPGAPLWRLVRFADGLPDQAAAGIEGALYGAGMLTAWIHPDPALTSTAVAGAEADGYLVAVPPADRPSGRTLADVLVPEEQDLVPLGVVEAMLRSVLVVDENLGENGAEAASGHRWLPFGPSTATECSLAPGPRTRPSSSGRPTERADAAPGSPSWMS